MSLTERMAHALVRRRIRKRVPVAWHADPAQRRLLLVLPGNEEAAVSAWRFVESLGVDPARVYPIVPSGEIAYAPVAYIGRVQALGKKDQNRLGLPKKAILKAAWAFRPDVAMDLSPTFTFTSAMLVGASPAAFRIGLAGAAEQADAAEPFYDLLVGVRENGGIEGAVKQLAETLRRIEPRVIG